MKSISIDFMNHIVCIMSKGQHGTEFNPDLKKVAFNSFIPPKYQDQNSFTWNFENETFAVNQDFLLHDGCIMTEDDFLPEIIIPMSGLGKRYEEFISIMNYEEVDLKEEMPAGLRKLLGLDD